jgi:hypothetical protein
MRFAATLARPRSWTEATSANRSSRGRFILALVVVAAVNADNRIDIRRAFLSGGHPGSWSANDRAHAGPHIYQLQLARKTGRKSRVESRFCRKLFREAKRSFGKAGSQAELGNQGASRAWEPGGKQSLGTRGQAELGNQGASRAWEPGGIWRFSRKYFRPIAARRWWTEDYSTL